MPKFFVENSQIIDDKINIVGTNVNHITNVLRMKKEDELQICDLKNGNNYLAQIIEFDKTVVKCKIKEKLQENNETKIDITLFQGVPKFDKMEWIIQKNTEIGVKEFVPVTMARCIAKIKDSSKIERWNKISEIAAKQSMRNYVPEVKEPINVDKLCKMIEQFDTVFLAYEGEQENTLKKELNSIEKILEKDITNIKKYKIGIIIGPEGGIDKLEVEKISKVENVRTITLGKRILRTETAGLVLASNIIYALDD